MSFPSFSFDFEVDRKSGPIDFDLSLRAFEVETRSFLGSEKDLIYGLTSMLQVREAIELPYSRIPALTFNPASVVKVRWVKIEPKGPYSVAIIGSPVSMLSTFSNMTHEAYHLDQIMHKSVFDAYILSESVMNRFRSMIRDEKDEKILKKLIKLTEAGILFNPLKIEEDKRCLLESHALHYQYLFYFPGITKFNVSPALHDVIPKIGDEKLEELRVKFLERVNGSKYHRDALEFLSNVMDKAATGFFILFVYLCLFSDFGVGDILKYVKELRDVAKALAYSATKHYILDEVGTGSISNELEKFVGERLNFGTYRRKTIEKFNGVIEKLEGLSKKRVGMLKEAIERSEKPSQFLDEVRKWACLILKDQDSRLYVQGYYEYVKPEYASLMLSFYSDLYICTSILNAANDAFRNGGDPWRAMERAIVCPFRKAPQMKCSSGCEHEKPWRNAMVER
jgi:hypothetical protein